jgi:hypothetical protein
MSLSEVTLDATLDTSGSLHLSQPPQLPPGPVRVTIRVAGQPRRTLADVVQEIAVDQQARGFTGLSPAELLAFDQARMAEDLERDREQEAGRKSSPPKVP